MNRRSQSQSNIIHRLCLTALFTVFCLLYGTSIQAQEPCETKQKYEEAQTQAKNAVHTIAEPAAPLGTDGSPLDRTALERSLQSAEDARSRAENTKYDHENALRDARSAVTRFNNDQQKGKRLTTLKSEIATLEARIRKAQEANARVSNAKRVELIKILRYEVEPLQQKISAQMPGLTLEDARDKMDDPTYEGFSNSEIDALRKEIDRNQALIKRIEDKYNNLTGTPEAGDDKQVEAARRAIASATARLKPAIEKCRRNVRADFSALFRKENEYDKEIEKLYPDQETRDLVANLGQMQADVRTRKEEEKKLSDEQKKLREAETKAREKLEGGTKNGQPFAGSRKAYEEADTKVKALEADLKKVTDYESKKKTWDEAEKKKRDADQKVTDLTTDYNNAVKAKNTALTQARASADLSTIDARMKRLNRTLLEQAKGDVLDSTEVKRTRKRLSARMRTLKTDAQKAELRKRWRAYVTRLVRPHYIRLRNQAEANRLRAIRDAAGLQKVKCFDDVQQFINKLNEEITRVLERTASLVSDMDPGAAAGADENIPVDPIPPLDEGGLEVEFQALTEQVEQATTKCDYREAARVISKITSLRPREQYISDWLNVNQPKLTELQDRERRALELIDQADATAGQAEAESLKDPADWNRVTTLAQQAVRLLTQADQEAPKCLPERQRMEQIRKRLAELAKRKKPAIAASIALLIDTSGSMGSNNKINQAKAAARRAARQVSRTTEIAVLHFAGGCGAGAMRVVAGFTTDLSKLLAAIDRLRPGGGTPMYIATAEAVAYAQKQGRGKQRTVVLMSDGGDSCRSRQAQAAASIRSSNIPVSTIGFDVGNNQQAQGDLGNLATMTGGRTFSASAADPREIIRAFNLAMLPSLLKDFDPGNAGSTAAEYFSQAKEMVQRQNVSGALMMLQQAKKVAPESPNLNFNLSLLYETEDQLIPAMNHANNYLRLAPQAIDRADVEKRIVEMQKELQRNPRVVMDSSGCRDVLSWARAEQNVARRARNASRRRSALEILIAAQRGDCEQARELQTSYRQHYQQD